MTRLCRHNRVVDSQFGKTIGLVNAVNNIHLHVLAQGDLQQVGDDRQFGLAIILCGSHTLIRKLAIITLLSLDVLDLKILNINRVGDFDVAITVIRYTVIVRTLSHTGIEEQQAQNAHQNDRFFHVFCIFNDYYFMLNRRFF